MSKEFFATPIVDFEKLVLFDSSNRTPIFLASAPGFDPSYKIQEVSKKLKKKFEAVAIGSAEGFQVAAKQLDLAIKKGLWVVFKNVHLACSWLRELEQKLLKSSPHRDFRIFLVSEFSEKLPLILLR